MTHLWCTAARAERAERALRERCEQRRRLMRRAAVEALQPRRLVHAAGRWLCVLLAAPAATQPEIGAIRFHLSIDIAFDIDDLSHSLEQIITPKFVVFCSVEFI